MGKPTTALWALWVFAACASEPRPDAGVGDAGLADASGPADAPGPADVSGPADASGLADASGPADAMAADAGSGLRCEQCAVAVCDPAACPGRRPLVPGAPYLHEDTATGARGDCALSGSGTGGKNLYYAVTIGQGRQTRIDLVPTSTVEHGGPMLRVFEDCAATEILALNRLEDPSGMVSLCIVRNTTSAPDRDLVLAVSNYHELDFRYAVSISTSTTPFNDCWVGWQNIP